MTDLLYARWQFGLSMAFHIVFASVGVAMPLLMAAAEWRWLRGRDPLDLELAHRWAKGTAILFAVGAVSGTVLSFELGLLWPRFMEFSGAIIGLPFAMEGFAFFTEAIFLGIYLYGWDRISPRLHLAAGLVVAVSGAASAFFVVLANAWMNSPGGFTVVDGRPADIDPLAAMFSPGWAHEVVHVLISCYQATAFAIAGIHALLLLREPKNRFHQRALAITLLVGGLAAVLQPLSGDFSARETARNQPLKLAAAEALFRTQPCAPLTLGGIPDPETATTRLGLEIPCGLSLLAYHDPGAVVQGMLDFPRDTWPNVRLVHFFFQIMVGCGSLMALVALAGAVLAVRRRGVPTDRWFLVAVALVSPLGFVAVEAGWMVTELGRQPWVIYGVMRTADAVTPVSLLAARFGVFSAIYLFLAVATAVLLWRQIVRSPHGA